MALMDKPAELWSVDEVSDWLGSVGHDEYAPTFAEHVIDGRALLTIAESDLRKPPLEIKRLGDIKNLMISIRELQWQNLGAVKQLLGPCELLMTATNNSAADPSQSISRRNSTRKHRRRRSVGSSDGTAPSPDISFEYDYEDDDGNELGSAPTKCRHLKPEIWKTAVGMLYFLAVTWITAIVMVIVHDRVPDMQTYPPLPDIFLDNVPHIPWAFAMGELTGLILFGVWLGDAKKAASCAYTFLEYNPDHVLMTSYLERYVATPGNDPKDIVSLDQKKYQELYIRAIGLHQRSEYAEECRVVEEVIESYLEAEEDCKILCEDFSPQRIWTRDFPAVATDHLVSALKCKSQCTNQLSYFNGRRYRNFFASLYQHLQFCYYHSQNLPRACEANQSFLLLVPDDADMWHNQAFYAQLPNVEEAWFKARKEVVEYLEHQQREQDLLRRLELRINERPTPREVSTTTESPPRRNLTVVEDERSLNGSRFVAEGFLTEDQCNSLVELAAEVAVAGDGYDGKQSPHSRFETFNGITLGSIAVLTRKGVVDDELARLLLDTSEQARNYVETYFALRSRLHFSYTHLVCRTAMTVEKEGPRNDMSHAVHADNCLLQPNGDCIKQRPAPIWRDYSAVLYLNDDFKGGDFVFGRSQDAIEARVSPKCGRMVAFSAGPENLHGVLPVERGRRCALALWFTLDPKYRERDMEFASHVLRRAAPQRRRSTSPPGGTRGDAGTLHESALKHGARARLSDEL